MMLQTRRILTTHCRQSIRFAASTASIGRGSKSQDPRAQTFEERGFKARDKRREQRYWPPPENDSLPPLPLPGGRKQVAVVASKSEVDGYLEAQVAFLTRGGNRLFHLNEEELEELEKLAPRISEYFELWEEKKLDDEIQEQMKAMESPLEKQRQLGE
eukprot:TRINITY_DN1938_c2_g1_i1.p1 TRINITY_DN1938_c2_g1~~TRINITY_DN1938_c2_g1_i1.p1  ORF type:complete len:158 (-),score=46.93 TRINITY_DN1938_c2_g1_i1:45-518(-)